MKVKQVFKTYDNLNRNKESRVRFCPVCGTEYIYNPNIVDIKKTCSNCGIDYYLNADPCVSILIADGAKFVLCKRGSSSYQKGKWCLPCGYIEFNEDFLSAAMREAKEETGLNVKIESILSVVSNFFTPDLHTLVVVLLARPISGTLDTLDNEIEAVQWFSNSEQLPEMAFEADTHIIERYFGTKLDGIPIDSNY